MRDLFCVLIGRKAIIDTINESQYRNVRRDFGGECKKQYQRR